MLETLQSTASLSPRSDGPDLPSLTDEGSAPHTESHEQDAAQADHAQEARQLLFRGRRSLPPSPNKLRSPKLGSPARLGSPRLGSPQLGPPGAKSSGARLGQPGGIGRRSSREVLMARGIGYGYLVDFDADEDLVVNVKKEPEVANRFMERDDGGAKFAGWLANTKGQYPEAAQAATARGA